MNLKDLPADAQPRQKLLMRGAAALSDTELLALLLRTGTAGRGVLQMAQEVLSTFGGIAGLLHTAAEDLKRIKGLGGPAKRAELMAVLELARRGLAQQLGAREVFGTPGAVKQFLQLHLARKQHEVFAVLFLDAQHRLIAMEELFQGTLTHTSVYPREIVKRALNHHAASVVLAHNHPSGEVSPSRADEALTQTLKSALALVDVRVLDHVIVAQGDAFSMAERGLL
ncbi:RadC family protein [Caenimonas aquaedulcis]|uniref:DNA repair protein RadC n=1 Tax=Caenimonas aquaedulcis TaxID=2793270 RepID=A0A931MHD2_9BURK|nr:DNA repair protein RadC [Caenimonas aquaedulcis]MBG9388085.1 DNA repair protein RadC [Caenimonas aquaedulcis]